MEEKLTSVIPKENIYYNEPMKKHTSFRIGGPADVFVIVNKIKELEFLIKVAQEENIAYTILRKWN